MFKSHQRSSLFFLPLSPIHEHMPFPKKSLNENKTKERDFKWNQAYKWTKSFNGTESAVKQMSRELEIKRKRKLGKEIDYT